MATFTGKQIKNTYQGIVQIDEGVLKDGLNNPLTASIDTLTVDNSFKVNSISPKSGTKLSVTGSIESTQPFVSASHALQADAALTAVSASYALTASFSLSSSVQVQVSSSHAETADQVPFTGITGKPTLLSGSTQIGTEISGSFNQLSSSIATRFDNISHSDVSGLNAATSSYALKTQITGSFKFTSASLVSRIASNDSDITNLTSTNNTLSARINNLTAATSSYALNTEISGSFNLTSASLASRIINNDSEIASLQSATSSFITNEQTGSMSVATASFALNAGGGSGTGFPFTGSATISGSLNVDGPVTASGFISTAASGTPTLKSSTNLILSASNAVVLSNSPLRLGLFTNAQTGSLASQDGDLIYNTTRKAMMLYSGSNWHRVNLS
tara:strand:+ start:208 stop:1374 length:1167 start_codon:yes stop_codon:yes gene_type:complete